MDFKRKELAKNAKKNLKKHYWLLVAVCLFAAFIGSEFTETMEAFKSLGTVNNEIQGAASVEANVDTVANSSVVSSVVQAMGAVITGDDDLEGRSLMRRFQRPKTMQPRYWEEQEEYLHL